VAVPRTPLQAFVFLFALWAALVLLTPIVHAAEGGGADPGLAPLEDAFYDTVNQVRQQQGLIALRRDPTVDRVARAHSRDMVARGYFAHETPEGLTPPDRLARGGVSGISLAGENVGLTSRGDPNREIVEGWLASPVHRQNLLAPMFNVTGVGVARAADGTFFYTQLYVTVSR
jgi:uncharacterized protein YkwD